MIPLQSSPFSGFIGIVALVWVAISIATLQHASSNDKSPYWFFVVLLTGLFGLVIYAISLASD